VTSTEPQLISSRDNALLKELRRLAQDSTAYRKQGRVWLEGDHLCRAFSEGFWPQARTEWGSAAVKTVVIADQLFTGLSGLESPAPMAFVIDLPAATVLDPQAASVILDRVQDAGNVGAILRSAGAFGFRQVIALKGTAALWSPKVLRAGMGAHFGLRLVESVEPAALEALAVPILTTSSHHGDYLHRAKLPWPCAWALGHEGQGVGDAVGSRASQTVRIIQPGGEESLNVASAAAICLHASATQQAS
jgi:TrmH family RNA methyltransferase